MAAIKLGAIVTDIKGKLGGHVFQKSNQSTIIRTGNKTRKNETPLNRLTQNRVNGVIQEYSGLTPALKQGWATAALPFSFKNKFGDSVKFSGRQFYIRQNTNALRGGHPMVGFPNLIKATTGKPTVTAINFNVLAGTGQSVGSGSIANNRYVYMMQKVGDNSLKPRLDKFVFNSSQALSNFTTTTLYNNYKARYGVPAVTDNIWFSVSLINTSGFESFSIILKVTIT